MRVEVKFSLGISVDSVLLRRVGRTLPLSVQGMAKLPEPYKVQKGRTMGSATTPLLSCFFLLEFSRVAKPRGI